jgi:hypothetical protein
MSNIDKLINNYFDVSENISNLEKQKKQLKYAICQYYNDNSIEIYNNGLHTITRSIRITKNLDIRKFYKAVDCNISKLLNGCVVSNTKAQAIIGINRFDNLCDKKESEVLKIDSE